MIFFEDLTLFLYNLTLVPVIMFSTLFFLTIIGNIVLGKETSSIFSKKKKKPFISIQIPVYNDMIATDCVKHCLKQNYPKNKYEIIIVDDSTDKAIKSSLKTYSIKYPGFVKYISRTHRTGFKPGALQNAMKITKGEFIVVFDSDWKPPRDFLNKIIHPMLEDDEVIFVQAKQDFVNLNQNLISRFAGYLLMIYHSMIMPISNRLNTVFLCGTAFCLRKKYFEETGGWNIKNLTEDADFSVKALIKGYKTVYVNLSVPSELPTDVESFIKQQMRWCYGVTRTFFDNFVNILLSKNMKITQKIFVSYLTIANIFAPVVILMTLFGSISWFLGEPEIFNLADFIDLFVKIILTGGFFLLGLFTFFKEKNFKQVPYLLLCIYSVSFLLLVFNTIAFLKAVFNSGLYWFRTPKSG